jgi:hypothetical protein
VTAVPTAEFAGGPFKGKRRSLPGVSAGSAALRSCNAEYGISGSLGRLHTGMRPARRKWVADDRTRVCRLPADRGRRHFRCRYAR